MWSESRGSLRDWLSCVEFAVLALSAAVGVAVVGYVVIA